MYSEYYNNSNKKQDISDVETEESLISSALNNPDDGVFVCEMLTHEDFTSRRCSLIFVAMQTMIQNGDLSTDVNELRKTLKANGSDSITVNEIMRIVTDVPLAINIDARIADLKELTRRRKTHRILTDGCTGIRDGTASIADIIERITAIGKDGEGANDVFMHVSNVKLEKSSWLIKRFIERDCIAELFGASGSYKSFLAIHAGLSIASGKPFFGMPVKRTGPVLFIIGEGQAGFKRRLTAWSLCNGVDLNSLPVMFSTKPAEMTVAESVSYLKAGIRSVQKKYGDPAMIIIDTLNRNYGPGDENSTADMTRFVAGCDALRLTCGASVLVVHHSGHLDRDRSRGSSVLGSAVDYRYRVEANKDGTINLSFMKCKDQSIPSPRTLKPKVIDLGTYDGDGEPESSCILEEVDYQPSDAGKDRSGKGTKQQLMKSVLDRMVIERDMELVSSGQKAKGRIQVSEWLSKLSESGCTRNDKTRAKEYFAGHIVDGFIYSKSQDK